MKNVAAWRSPSHLPPLPPPSEETEHIHPIPRFDNGRVSLKGLYNCRTNSWEQAFAIDPS